MLALELKCANKLYMNDIAKSDIPTIYKKCLAVLME